MALTPEDENYLLRLDAERARDELHAQCSEYERQIAILTDNLRSAHIWEEYHVHDHDALRERLAATEVERDALRACLAAIREFIKKTPEDEGLWMIEKYASEAYLQQTMRRAGEEKA
jgi:hypothetical protein